MSLHRELAEISSDLICDMELVNEALERMTEDQAMAFIKALVSAISTASGYVSDILGHDQDGLGALTSCWVYGFLIGREHGKRGYGLIDQQ